MSVRTVWAKDALLEIPERYRPLVTVVYPLIYGINIALFGIYGTITGGTQTMRDAYPYPGASLFCLLVGISALIAFIGIALQRQRTERIGDGLLVAATATYLVLLVFALTDRTPQQPIATITTTAAFTILALFRIRDLSRDIGRRKQRGDYR